jgi:hypothetical protein
MFNGKAVALNMEINSYGKTIPSTENSFSEPSGNQRIGITTDSAKSGIVGTVTRQIFSILFAIKY